jgi:hypothetical protein
MSNILGFWIYIENKQPAFILDESNLWTIRTEIGNVIKEDDFLALLNYSREEGPVTLSNAGVAIEPVTNACYVPPFVLLSSIEAPSQKFITQFEPGIDPRVIFSGETAYDILGFANTIGEAQRKLYGVTMPKFTKQVSLSKIRATRHQSFGAHEEESE